MPELTFTSSTSSFECLTGSSRGDLNQATYSLLSQPIRSDNSGLSSVRLYVNNEVVHHHVERTFVVFFQELCIGTGLATDFVKICVYNTSKAFLKNKWSNYLIPNYSTPYICRKPVLKVWLYYFILDFQLTTCEIFKFCILFLVNFVFLYLGITLN